jgi:ribosome-associated protein
MTAIDLSLGPGRFIPRHELSFRATRAGGPGGQHVNTSSSRVEVRWNVKATPVLSDDERARVLKRLATRIDGRGNLRVTAAQSRSQLVNRERAEERLAELVRRALVVQKKRKATSPSAAAVEARIRQKKLRGERKRERALPADD